MATLHFPRDVLIAVVIAGFGLFATACATEIDTLSVPNESVSNGRHWPSDGGEVRVGILLYKSLDNQGGVIQPDQLQRIANAARIWSDGTPGLDIGIAGYATAEDCQLDDPIWGRVGYIVICLDVKPGPMALAASQCDWQWWRGEITSTEQNAGVVCSRIHAEGGMVRFGSSVGQPTSVHEIGHVIGLGHGGGAAMEVGSGVSCPAASDFALLAEIYAHDDGYTSAVPVGPWIVEGVNPCVVTQSPTPTVTPEPTTTVSPTPTPTPEPKCPPGWRRQGRC